MGRSRWPFDAESYDREDKPTVQERVAMEVALLLLALDQEQISEACSEALDLATRALMARRDPTWWRVPGRPALNAQLSRLRQALISRDIKY